MGSDPVAKTTPPGISCICTQRIEAQVGMGTSGATGTRSSVGIGSPMLETVADSELADQAGVEADDPGVVEQESSRVGVLQVSS